MKKIFIFLIISLVFCINSVEASFCDLAGFVGNEVYFMQIDYENNNIELINQIQFEKNVISVSFSQDRSGNVIVFLGQREKGWNQVQMYDNLGKYIKEVYSGEYYSDLNPVSNGNYIVYTEGNWCGGVLKNNKIIMHYMDNCRYKGVFGDKAYISRGNDRGNCYSFYEVDLVTKEVTKKIDEFNANGNFEMIDSIIYFVWSRGEGGSRVAKLTPNYSSYYYSDLVGQYCIMRIMGINDKYAFTLCGISPQSKWHENMGTKFGDPKLFCFENKKMIVLHSDSGVFDNLKMGECGFDLF